MKLALMLACGATLAAATAFAQGESIGVFADPAGTDCHIVDAAPGLISIYVVHIDSPGAGASMFSAPLPGCMTGAVWMSDTALFAVTIGDSQSGVAIGYGTCSYSPIHVLTINVFAQGLSEACCGYTTLPDPNAPSGPIEVVNCSDTIGYAGASTARVNPDGACSCGSSSEEATWGKVKAIFDG